MILFFDTETTGLPKNWNAEVSDIDNWPRLVQLAYLIYDYEGTLIYSSNEIVRPSLFEIPIESSNVHGITTEIASKKGIYIKDVIELFNYQVKRCDVIVAHNLGFDEKVVGAELLRLGYENIFKDKEGICTMLKTVNLCKLPGHNGYKWPKLQELHLFLFGFHFTGEHDALSDVRATAKCFWELIKNNQIKVKQLLRKSEESSNQNEIDFFSSWNKTWSIEVNQINSIFNKKSKNKLFYSKDENYFATIDKQFGVEKQIKSSEKFKDLNDYKIASHENISCVISENNIWILGASSEIIHHCCLADDMYIELLKIESIDEHNIVIRYTGNQELWYWVGGILIFNINQKKIIYYRNCVNNEQCKNRYNHILEYTDLDKFGKSQIFNLQYHCWEIIGLQLFSVYSKRISDSYQFEFYLEKINLYNEHDIIEDIQLCEITNVSNEMLVSILNPDNIQIISEKKIININLKSNDKSEFDFSSFGNFKGLFRSSLNLYLSLEKNFTPSILALKSNLSNGNYELVWFKNNIEKDFFFHPDYSIILAQNSSDQGLIIDGKTGELLSFFNKNQSKILDVSFVNRTYMRRGFQPQRRKSIRNPNIFKMEDRGWGKDKVIFIKEKQGVTTIYNKLLEDLIITPKDEDEEDIPTDLPF